jgi:hypothetical protein
MTAVDDALAAQLAAAGLSNREIARQVGVTDKAVPPAVRRHLRRERDPTPELRERLSRLPAERLLLLESFLDLRELELFHERVMRDHPESLESVAERWGVTRQRVHRIEGKMLAKLEEALSGPDGSDQGTAPRRLPRVPERTGG